MAGEAYPIQEANDVRGPVEAAAEPIKPMRLSGTGTTSARNATALRAECMATFLNGSTAVRFRLGDSSVSAGTTDPNLGPYARLDWMVTAGTDDYISIEAADGAAAFEGHAFTSSGPRA